MVCEGFHEVGFLCNLLRSLGIANCDVTFPKKVEHGGNGKARIIEVLKGLASRKQGLEGVMVLWDADLDAQTAFKEARMAFTFKDSPFTAPPTPFVIHQGTIRTAIFITPGAGRTGTLEHLMLDAANTNRPDLAACVEQLCICVGMGQRELSENDKAKARLAAMIAASCDEPTCSLAWIWGKVGNPIPIDSPHFAELSDFLRLFTETPQMSLPL